MLFKSHSLDFAEDFGLMAADRSNVHLYENGPQRCSKKLQLSPVVRVNALWLEKDLRVRCTVADTMEKKRIGLQWHRTPLIDGEGMYFPYEPFSEVTFHQGTVNYPLDLLFLCEDQIIQTEENTKVGGSDRWTCAECDGVVEVIGGWCSENGVEVGDRVFISAVSEQDLVDLEREKANDLLLAWAESLD